MVFTMHTPNHTVQTAPRSLADYSSAESLIVGLSGRAAPAILDELIRALHVEDRREEVFYAGLKSLNSALLIGPVDAGTLIASVDLPGETRPRFALGSAWEPLPWRASKLTPIEIVILLVEPSRESVAGKQVLAALTRLTRDRDRLSALCAARCVEDMLAVLAQVPVLANVRDPTFPSSVPQPEAKLVITVGTFERGARGKHHWSGPRSVVSRP
jgi:hypothetical protein